MASHLTCRGAHHHQFGRAISVLASQGPVCASVKLKIQGGTKGLHPVQRGTGCARRSSPRTPGCPHNLRRRLRPPHRVCNRRSVGKAHDCACVSLWWVCRPPVQPKSHIRAVTTVQTRERSTCTTFRATASKNIGSFSILGCLSRRVFRRSISFSRSAHVIVLTSPSSS